MFWGMRMKRYRFIAFRHQIHLTAGAMHRQKTRRLKKLNGCIRKLKSDMVDIGKEHNNIKEEQRHVREKFEAIESQYDQLRNETNQIMQQSRNTQIRLALMFQILKARENQEHDKAAQLTSALRELIEREKQQRNDI